MPWQCACSELHDDAFDCCWNCGCDRDGTPQPFARDTDPPEREAFIEALADHADEIVATVARAQPGYAWEARTAARLAALETEVVSLRKEVRSLREQVRAGEKQSRNA